jgi:hypothetical protein
VLKDFTDRISTYKHCLYLPMDTPDEKTPAKNSSSKRRLSSGSSSSKRGRKSRQSNLQKRAPHLALLCDVTIEPLISEYSHVNTIRSCKCSLNWIHLISCVYCTVYVLQKWQSVLHCCTVLYTGTVMHSMRTPSTVRYVHVLYTDYWLLIALQKSGALVWNFVCCAKNTPKEAIHALVGHSNARILLFRWGKARSAKREMSKTAVPGGQNFTLH